MLYIIGLGLNLKGISLEGISALKKCKKVYLENYTVEFPYSISELEKVLKRKIIEADRNVVESDILIKEALRENICLLIYGSPLFATTHMSLIEDCKKNKIKFKIIYSSSVFDALGETGLQLYKFGKISSMPKWQEHFTPVSFLESVLQNRKIDAHTLILVDIGLKFENAINEMEIASKETGIKIDKIVVCSKVGLSGKIYYGSLKKLKSKKVPAPFCFIVPGKMHFLEEEGLKSIRV